MFKTQVEQRAAGELFHRQREFVVTINRISRTLYSKSMSTLLKGGS